MTSSLPAEWHAALLLSRPADGKLRAVAVGLAAADVVAVILATAEAQLQAAPSAAGKEGEEAPGEAQLQAEVEALRRQVELLQTLLGHGAGCVLEELGSPGRSEALLGRLVAAERYGLAVYAAKRLRFSVPSYWEAWGFALMQVRAPASQAHASAHASAPPSQRTLEPCRTLLITLHRCYLAQYNS